MRPDTQERKRMREFARLLCYGIRPCKSNKVLHKELTLDWAENHKKAWRLYRDLNNPAYKPPVFPLLAFYSDPKRPWETSENSNDRKFHIAFDAGSDFTKPGPSPFSYWVVWLQLCIFQAASVEHSVALERTRKVFDTAFPDQGYLHLTDGTKLPPLDRYEGYRNSVVYGGRPPSIQFEVKPPLTTPEAKLLGDLCFRAAASPNLNCDWTQVPGLVVIRSHLGFGSFVPTLQKVFPNVHFVEALEPLEKRKSNAKTNVKAKTH